MKLVVIFVLGLLALLAGSCGNNTANGFNDVLQQPPYAGLTDSIKESPADAALLLQRAVLLTQNNQHDIAYYDYKKSWELKPTENTALLFAANLFLTGRGKDAVSFLKQCKDRYPGNTEFLRRLGEAYTQNGRSQDAIALYDELLQKDSNNFEALFEKGMLYTQLKDTPNAIATLEKAYYRQPVLQNGIALANLYAETKNPKVIALCDALQKRDTARDFTDPVFLKGVYYSNIKDYPRAIALFDEAINRDWRFVEPYIEKGIILFEEKNYDEALKTFQYATNIAYTSADNYYWMGRCYEAIGKKDEAIDYYYKALTFDRDFTEAREAIQRLKAK
ncbi:MAG TPA: tetratricopeptide repeat protein [Chitinophagaceae bacterium]|nr:tetratricopeptide repeat protein [Chitinophagaceae bacterium]